MLGELERVKTTPVVSNVRRRWAAAEEDVSVAANRGAAHSLALSGPLSMSTRLTLRPIFRCRLKAIARLVGPAQALLLQHRWLIRLVAIPLLPNVHGRFVEAQRGW